MSDTAKHDGDNLRVGIILLEPFADVCGDAMFARGGFGQSVGEVVRNAVNGSKRSPIGLARDTNLVRGPVRGHPDDAHNIRRVIELNMEEFVNPGKPHLTSSGSRLTTSKGTQGTQAVNDEPVARLRVERRLVQCPGLTTANTVNPGGGEGQPPRR